MLVISQGLGYILAENISFKQNVIGVKSTNALIGLIYDKQMRLSSATNKNFTQGEIVTFVQIDAQKLIYLASQLPAIATLPFTLTLCFTFLFKYMGISFFAGIGVFILSLVVNIAISRCNARNQKKYMKLTDARVGVTTECLNNIKMIKLYSWIPIFRNMIRVKRNEELSFQFIRMNYIMLTLGSLTFFPLLLQIVSFATFIGTGHSMDLSLAYTIITIFNLIL
jgi:ABC-type multidrug transport system fused ATPase/permease subunit